jgi:hypothetical protein
MTAAGGAARQNRERSSEASSPSFWSFAECHKNSAEKRTPRDGRTRKRTAAVPYLYRVGGIVFLVPSHVVVVAALDVCVAGTVGHDGRVEGIPEVREVSGVDIDLVADAAGQGQGDEELGCAVLGRQFDHLST